MKNCRMKTFSKQVWYFIWPSRLCIKNQTIICHKVSFEIDHLDLDFKQNKTVNNDVNMKNCRMKTCSKEVWHFFSPSCLCIYNQTIVGHKVSFEIDHLDLDLKQNKTLNNDVNMKNCRRIMVQEESGVLSDRPAYAFRIKLSLATKSVLK